MNVRKTLVLTAAAIVFAATSSSAASVYAGLLGVGVQTTRPLGEDRLSWGAKAEAGILDDFALSPQATLRYDLPSNEVPVYLQIGLGARLKVGDSAKVQPFGSISVGMEFEKYHLLIQLPGYPVIGLEFPMDNL